MEDLFKKFLYTGIGFVSLTAEKLQDTVDELVGKGKLSKDEGRKIIDDFFSSTESKKDEFESKLKDAVENVMDKLTFTTKSDYDALVKRVETLEKAKGSVTVKKAATKKTATKKAPPKS